MMSLVCGIGENYDDDNNDGVSMAALLSFYVFSSLTISASTLVTIFAPATRGVGDDENGENNDENGLSEEASSFFSFTSSSLVMTSVTD